jgi:hypothetical protein
MSKLGESAIPFVEYGFTVSFTLGAKCVTLQLQLPDTKAIDKVSCSCFEKLTIPIGVRPLF